MKKAFFAGIAVLFALVIVTCDLFPPAETGDNNNNLVYEENGQPLVSLAIGTPNVNRALTGDLAQAEADYYEVAFYDGTNVYRASWDYTKTGKILVPPANYGGAARAILFAGRQLDKTLLAVGIITAIDRDNTGVDATNAMVLESTKSVTFTLDPLKTDVKSTSGSTFEITGPVSPDYDYTTVFPTPTVQNTSSEDIPVFLVPAGDSTITATYALDTVGGVFATGNTYNAGIIVQNADTNDPGDGGWLHFAGVSTDQSDFPVLGTGNISNLTVSDALPATLNLAIETSTSGTDGFTQFSIAVPVCAISDTATTNPIIWYVRGGLQNGLSDAGNTANSLGGAVLLGVGTVSTDDITIFG